MTTENIVPATQTAEAGADQNYKPVIITIGIICTAGIIGGIIGGVLSANAHNDPLSPSDFHGCAHNICPPPPITTHQTNTPTVMAGNALEESINDIA